MNLPPLRLPRAILFDMDGTLTEPLLDFPRIKAEMGIGNRPILESLAMMTPADRQAAEAILHRHEDQAAQSCRLNEGCESLLRWLDEHHIPQAIITRNSRSCARIILDRHRLAIEILITREDGPFKPDPHPLLLACKQLNVNPAEAWMVGDGVYDVQAAHHAEIPSIWLSHGKPRPFADEPAHTIAQLPNLLLLLQALRDKGDNCA
ncbi:MAG: HAD family hydrolase [Phycisphaerales bacterium]|jgi:HAD superfamily hydrolase (TIGR01549 family)|nr:HAD family hydrolase [Phycisphaerales bacterium]